MADGGGGSAKGSAFFFALRELVGRASFGVFDAGDHFSKIACFGSVGVVFGPQREQAPANLVSVVRAMVVLFVQDQPDFETGV